MTQTANAAGLVGLETMGKSNETQQTISDISTDELTHTVAFAGNNDAVHSAGGRHQLVIVDAVITPRSTVAKSDACLTVLWTRCRCVQQQRISVKNQSYPNTIFKIFKLA